MFRAIRDYLADVLNGLISDACPIALGSFGTD